MTPIQCAMDIADFLEGKFADFSFSDEKLSGKKINIRSGFMPVSRSNEDKFEQGGYINIRPIEIDDNGDDDEESSVVMMQILVVTYNADINFGHIELYNILEVIRRNLLATPIINKRYEVSKPLKTHIPDNQPYPQWLGYIEATIKIPEITSGGNFNV